MQKLGKLQSGEPRFWDALESGRWGLAKRGPISSGKAPQLRETETVGNVPDVHDIGISVAQRAADFLQPTQQHILGGGHAKKFGAARPKGPVAHHDQPAQLGHMKGPAEMFRQDLLDPDHDSGMMELGIPVGTSPGGRQQVINASDPVRWPARPRSATTSWTLSGLGDRSGRAGVAPGSQDAWEAARFALPVAQKRAFQRATGHNVRVAPGPSLSRCRRRALRSIDAAARRGRGT